MATEALNNKGRILCEKYLPLVVIGMAAAASWKSCLATWSGDHDTLLNAADVLKHLEDPEGLFFSEMDDEINVRITDVNKGILTDSP